MQDSIENIQSEELNGDVTSPTTSVETSADDEKKQLSGIDNSAESDESNKAEKKKEAKKPLVKKFDLYIIKKFIGTFFFIILMLFVGDCNVRHQRKTRCHASCPIEGNCV